MTLAEFRRVYPTAAFTVSSGKLFTYRYYQNPQAKATLVLLTGGIGLSDLFYKHFARFARDFSVLTFDYQLQFGDNGEFADAVAELLRHLKEKVWLVGQSLGGVVAQVIASRHPEVVEGLVLSNTCSLSGNMSKAGYQDLMKIIESQRKFKKWLAFLPFPLIKRMMRWAVMKKKTDGFTAQEKAAMEELCGAMMELLTKPYEQHMIDFLCDAEHYFGMTRNDFAPWEGRVLLILSEDDTTFTPACREDLIALMPSPTVVTDLTGGHLALMGVSGDTVRNYISLTNLVPELMQMVDDGKIALSPAYQIAALKPEEQQMLVTTIDYEQATPSLSQAQRMKKFSQTGKLNEDSMLAIMSEEKKPEKFSLTLDGDRIRKYFPKSYTPLQMENTIIKLLEAWQKKRQRSQER